MNSYFLVTTLCLAVVHLLSSAYTSAANDEIHSRVRKRRSDEDEFYEIPYNLGVPSEHLELEQNALNGKKIPEFSGESSEEEISSTSSTRDDVGDDPTKETSHNAPDVVEASVSDGDLRQESDEDRSRHVGKSIEPDPEDSVDVFVFEDSEHLPEDKCPCYQGSYYEYGSGDGFWRQPHARTTHRQVQRHNALPFSYDKRTVYGTHWNTPKLSAHEFLSGQSEQYRSGSYYGRRQPVVRRHASWPSAPREYSGAAYGRPNFRHEPISPIGGGGGIVPEPASPLGGGIVVGGMGSAQQWNSRPITNIPNQQDQRTGHSIDHGEERSDTDKGEPEAQEETNEQDLTKLCSSIKRYYGPKFHPVFGYFSIVIHGPEKPDIPERKADFTQQDPEIFRQIDERNDYLFPHYRI